jgi:integrase
MRPVRKIFTKDAERLAIKLGSAWSGNNDISQATALSARETLPLFFEQLREASAKGGGAEKRSKPLQAAIDDIVAQHMQEFHKAPSLTQIVHQKRVRLGKTLSEAMAAWAKLIEPEPGTLKFMRNVFERYRIEVIPTKKSQTATYTLKPLIVVFGDMMPCEIKPRHVYAYMDKRSKASPGGVLKDVGLLSSTLTKCIEWGLIEANPCFQVSRKNYQRPPRTRYVTDDEFNAVYGRANERVQIVMDLAVLTGLRRADILGLTRESLCDDGILVTPSKTEGSTGKTLLILWSGELRSVVERAKKLKRQVRQPLVCNRQGKAYTGDGFNSMWQRLIKDAYSKGLITSRFMFKDLRAKSATDDDVLAAASERLGHSSQALTKRVYIWKPTRVRPLR